MSQPLIVSLLDTDLYKLTMQAAVLDHFPEANVEYGFTNRTPELKLNNEAIEWLEGQIKTLGDLRFTESELDFLKTAAPYLSSKYLNYLKNFKLFPHEQIKIDYNKDTKDLSIKISGLWVETILYEIPLLALVSEAYFKFVDKDWTYDGQYELAAEKAKQLINYGCLFSEFGSRRRRSYKTHQLVIEGIIDGARQTKSPEFFVGTSNVHFAHKYNLKPIGTVAHEWMMGIAAYTQDYMTANRKAMELWIATLGKENVGVALTDTFGSDNFLKYLIPPFSDIYLGVRQDSGDPAIYTKLLGEHYSKLGYPNGSKRIVYSDSLDIEKCKLYKKAAEDSGLVASFGVGTFFTNDFKSTKEPYGKSKPLNIVIKISAINGHPAIKLSDNLGKNTGDHAEVIRVKKELGYIERDWEDGNESNRWISSGLSS